MNVSTGQPNLVQDDAVIAWLLESDPSIRWQVLRDLTNAPAKEVAAERAKVATTGWGAKLLAMQASNGRWGGAAWNHGWNSTMHVLMLLRDMGLEPKGEQAQHALKRVRSQVTWRGCGPSECDENAFFEGELEPCINGQVAAAGAYFQQDMTGIVGRLLREQLTDGGWNCDETLTRSSFNTTICVLEALLAHEQASGNSLNVKDARLRGEDYLLQRQLFKRLSTGEVIQSDRKGNTAFTDIAFPTWWHYDILRALDYFYSTGAAPDERLEDAIQLLLSKRDEQGRWALELMHEGTMPIDFAEEVGQPSRWNTLRALRVLKWFDGQPKRDKADV
ncbi:MAG: hypothetical protein AAF708_15775 [Deinococcota bacterium]